MRKILKLAAVCMASVGLGILSATPAGAAAPAAATAVAAHSPAPAVVAASRPLTGVEMASVRGAGFWSSFWQGIKFAGELVIIFGVAWVVDDFCSQQNVTCTINLE